MYAFYIDSITAHMQMYVHVCKHSTENVTAPSCVNEYLDSVDEEAVHDVDGDVAVDGGEEEGEEPAEGDHGQNLQLVLEQLEEIGQVLDHHVLEHNWRLGGGRKEGGKGGRK